MTQHHEELRLQVDELHRQNLSLQSQKHHQYSTSHQLTTDNRHEIDEVSLIVYLFLSKFYRFSIKNV